MNTPAAGRYYWIDYLRTAAVCAVIMIHITGRYYASFGGISISMWWFANLLNSLSQFAVPVFVMISGFLLLGKKEEPVMFYRRRLKRVLIPLMFWTVFYCACRYFWGGENQGDLQGILLTTFLSGQAFYHLWYLLMFVWLLLYSPFFAGLLSGEGLPKSHRKPLFVVITATALTMFVVQFLNELGYEWHVFQAFPRYILYYLAGYVLGHSTLGMAKKSYYFFAASLIALGLGLNYVVVSRFHVLTESPLFFAVGPFTMVLSLGVFIQFREGFAQRRPGRIVMLISECSFGIYLIHPFVIKVLDAVSQKFLGPVNPAVSIVIYFFGVLLLSLAGVMALRQTRLGRQIT